MMQKNLSSLKIPVTVSDLAYGFQITESQNSSALLNDLDFIGAHILPYFAGHASTGENAWNDVMYDTTYWLEHSKGKPIIFTENGWPHWKNCPNVCPQSANASASQGDSKAFWDLLDGNCDFFKNNSIGW